MFTKDDYDQLKYLKRLLKRWTHGQPVVPLLLRNHVVTTCNIFGEHALPLLFQRNIPEDYPALKALLEHTGVALPKRIKFDLNGKRIIVMLDEIVSDPDLLQALNIEAKQRHIPFRHYTRLVDADYITPIEIIKAGVSKVSLYRWIREGRLTASKRNGRIQILRDDWQRFQLGIEAGETEPHISTADIIKECGVSHQNLDHWIRNRKLLTGKRRRSGAPWRIAVSEWERFKATALIQDYVQPDEIAKQCGVTIDTVWRWIRTEKIEASRFAHYRVSRPEFERFMQHRKHK